MVNRFVMTLMVLASLFAADARGEIVHVEVMEGTRADPSTQPAEKLQIPADAKTVSTFQTLISPGGEFLAVCTIGDRVISLKGKVKPWNGDRMIEIDFSDRDGTNVQQVTTTYVLRVGQKKPLSGSYNDKRVHVIVVTIKKEEDL